MGYQVALSPSARHDLRDIVRYISLDSPERAVRFAKLVMEKVERSSLLARPDKGAKDAATRQRRFE